MAKSQKDKLKKHLPVRYTRRRSSGYLQRVRTKTRLNKLKQLDKHISCNPNDKLAVEARLRWIKNV